MEPSSSEFVWHVTCCENKRVGSFIFTHSNRVRRRRRMIMEHVLQQQQWHDWPYNAIFVNRLPLVVTRVHSSLHFLLPWSFVCITLNDGRITLLWYTKCLFKIDTFCFKLLDKYKVSLTLNTTHTCSPLLCLWHVIALN